MNKIKNIVGYFVVGLFLLVGGNSNGEELTAPMPYTTANDQIVTLASGESISFSTKQYKIWAPEFSDYYTGIGHVLIAEVVSDKGKTNEIFSITRTFSDREVHTEYFRNYSGESTAFDSLTYAEVDPELKLTNLSAGSVTYRVWYNYDYWYWNSSGPDLKQNFVSIFEN